MTEKNFIEAVTERDIDLLILEELHVSSEFRIWFVKQVYVEVIEQVSFVNAWHSLSDSNLGESDLVLLFNDSAGRKCAILIENKIDAPPQPEQSQRYQERGKAGIKAKEWDIFKTCIIAPESYLSKKEYSEGYDSIISYESIRDWFKQYYYDPNRSLYKSHLLQDAIIRNRRGYIPKNDEKVTKFWHEYWLLASKEFPELAMKKPGDKPGDSSFIIFKPRELDKGISIIHKMSHGVVDLQIEKPKRSLEKYNTVNKSLLGKDVYVVNTGKSISFRIVVPVLDIKDDLSGQEKEVRIGLKAASNLLFLAGRIR